MIKIDSESFLSEVTTRFVEISSDNIDHNYIAQRAVSISGARYGIFNLFDDMGESYTSLGFAGVDSSIIELCSKLGLDYIKRRWTYNPDQELRVKQNRIIHYDDFETLLGDQVPRTIQRALKKTLNIKKTLVVSIKKDGRALGDLTLIYENGVEPANLELLETYSDLVGLLLYRLELSRKLSESHTMLTELFEISESGYFSLDVQTGEFVLSSSFIKYFNYEYGQITLEKWLDNVHPDDKYKVEMSIYTAMKGEHSFSDKYRIMSKSGDYIWISGKGRSYKCDIDSRPSKILCVINDITDEVNLNEKIENSECNFKSLFDTIEDMIVVTDKSGQIRYTNKSIEKKLKYTDKQLLNMGILELHPENLRSEAFDIMEMMFNGKADICPLPLIDSDSNIVPVETRIWECVWDNQSCFFGISKDLSKEQESLQMFRKIFNHHPALIGVSELPSRRFVDVNPMFEQVTGYTKEDVLGKTSAELGFFVDNENASSITEQIKNTGSVKNLIIKIKTKTGNIIEGYFFGEVVKSQNKEYFYTVFLDTTEQIKINKQLKYQNKRLENIINGSELGTWEWNIKTGEVAFNERWANIIGYTLNELSPVTIDTWMRLAHPDDLKLSNELLKRHFEGKTEQYVAECRMLHKDGNWRWVLDQGKVIDYDENGKPLLMFGTHTEITKEKLWKLSQEKILDKIRTFYHDFDDLYDMIVFPYPSKIVTLKDYKITRREEELIKAVNKGQNNHEIADTMSISLSSVKVSLSRLYTKLHIKNRVDLVRFINDNSIDLSR